MFNRILLIFFLFLTGCGPRSLEHFRQEGQEIQLELIAILQKIDSREQLILAAPKLKIYFEELVETVIAAQEYKRRHPDEAVSAFTKEELATNESLRNELNRILRLEGCQELLEACQQEALYQLEKQKKY